MAPLDFSKELLLLRNLRPGQKWWTAFFIALFIHVVMNKEASLLSLSSAFK